jgi:hypothetical protein
MHWTHTAHHYYKYNVANHVLFYVYKWTACLAETHSSKIFTVHYFYDSLLIIFCDWKCLLLMQSDITVKDFSMFYYFDIMKCLQLIQHNYQINRHAPDVTFALYFLRPWSWIRDVFAKRLLPDRTTLAPVILYRPATEKCRRSCIKC